jgi:hypothetical protein
MTAYGMLNTREMNASHDRLAMHALTFIADLHFVIHIRPVRPPLRSSGQSSWVPGLILGATRFSDK